MKISDLVIFTPRKSAEIEILTKIRISPSENREKISEKKFCKKYIIHRSCMLMEYKAKKEVLSKITNDLSYFSYLHGDNGLF